MKRAVGSGLLCVQGVQPPPLIVDRSDKSCHPHFPNALTAVRTGRTLVASADRNLATRAPLLEELQWVNHLHNLTEIHFPEILNRNRPLCSGPVRMCHHRGGLETDILDGLLQSSYRLIWCHWWSWFHDVNSSSILVN